MHEGVTVCDEIFTIFLLYNAFYQTISCSFTFTDLTTGVVSLELDSIPAVKSSTTTTLTVTFRQDDMQVDSGVEQYYYYVLQYKTAQDSSYTDGTSLIQHVTDRGFRAEREFIIDGLQRYTAYQIRLVLYRHQDGITEQLAVTAATTGTTACSGEYNYKLIWSHRV